MFARKNRTIPFFVFFFRGKNLEPKSEEQPLPKSFLDFQNLTKTCENLKSKCKRRKNVLIGINFL